MLHSGNVTVLDVSPIIGTASTKLLKKTWKLACYGPSFCFSVFFIFFPRERQFKLENAMGGDLIMSQWWWRGRFAVGFDGGLERSKTGRERGFLTENFKGWIMYFTFYRQAEMSEAQAAQLNIRESNDRQAWCRLLLGSSYGRREVSDIRLGDSWAERQRGKAQMHMRWWST